MRISDWSSDVCSSDLLRRRFVKLVRNTKSPVAETALRHIAALYTVEAGVRGQTPEVRLAARRRHAAPIVEALKPWFETQLSAISSGSTLAGDIRSALGHWPGRSEEPTSELQSIMRNSYDVFCLKKKQQKSHVK